MRIDTLGYCIVEVSLETSSEQNPASQVSYRLLAKWYFREKKGRNKITLLTDTLHIFKMYNLINSDICIHTGGHYHNQSSEHI